MGENFKAVKNLTKVAMVAMGSNLGDRYQYLCDAKAQLLTLPQCGNFRFSSIYQTVSISETAAPSYLNAVVCFDTNFDPHTLLSALLYIEKNTGRERSYVNAPRTLDLDLLLYGDEIIADPDLIVPHPRMHERFFVLTPLREICPQVQHPLLHKTIECLEEELGVQQRKDDYITKYEQSF